MTAAAQQQLRFPAVLTAPDRSRDIPESADVYGWLCGSWDLDVVRYRGIDVSRRGMKGEVHAARVLEGRAVQDVWIMPAPDWDPTLVVYGTTLRWWDASIHAWRIDWTNPGRSHHEDQIGNW